jgi:hypothetical protein
MRNPNLYAVLVLLAIGTVANADQIPITFDTLQSTFLVAGSTQYNWQQLTFTPVSSTTVDAATLAAGGGSAGISSLGVFTFPVLDGISSASYAASDAFELIVNFTAPPGIDGGQATSWSTDFTGGFGCFILCGGNVDLLFNTWTQSVTYTDSAGFGQFTISLTGGTIANGGTQYEYVPSDFSLGSLTLTGQITDASFTPVPEPSLMIPLALGVLILLFKNKNRLSPLLPDESSSRRSTGR